MSSPPLIGLFSFWGGFDTNTVPFFKYLTENYGAIFTTEVHKYTVDLLIVSVFEAIPHNLKSIPTLLLAFEDYTRWGYNYRAPYHTDVDYAIVNNYVTSVPLSAKRCKQKIHMSLSVLSEYPIHDNPIFFTEGRKDLSINNKDKFCSFVFSNANMNDEGVLSRTDIFHAINNQYKKVDSAGGFLNNMANGERAPGGEEYNKWMSKYKFNICGENMIRPGYYTEKVLFPYKCGVIPIYNSHYDILDKINPKSMIFCCNKSHNQIIKEVIELDCDPHKYEEMLREPVFCGNHLPDCFSLVKGFELIDGAMSDLKFSKYVLKDHDMLM